MSTTIVYFSGTGNSLYVAKDIAQGTEGQLVPAATLMTNDKIEILSDTVGIVFPVYYGELPVIIKRFAEKLVNLNGKYLFAVVTFGGSAGHSLKLLARIIRLQGGELAATFGVHMPQNSFSKPWENHRILYKSWRRKAGRVVSHIQKREKGSFLKSFWLTPVYLLADPLVDFMKPRYKKAFARLSNTTDDLELDELIYLNDTSFHVSTECTGCGICSRVCPVNNIDFKNQRPFWLHHCENCLACYNWCPQKAIQGGVAAKGYFYRHPDIEMAEMIARKSG
jgi:ferredoxin/flavodoxin